MKKKIIKKKATIAEVALTLEDMDKKIGANIRRLDKKIEDLGEKMGRKFDEFKDHVDRKFNEQTVDLTNQIHDVLELVDNRLAPIEKNCHSKM